MIIDKFNPAHIDKVVEMATLKWGRPDQRPEFNRAFCGNIVRRHFFCEELCYQAEDEDGLQGICWAAPYGTGCESGEWLENTLPSLDGKEKETVLKDVAYLRHADNILKPMMSTSDIRLTLIISLKKGYGSSMLSHLMDDLSGKGYGYLFLWTDSTCDYSFYPRHGFEMVHQEKDTLFYGSEGRENRIMIFRRKIF